DRVGNSGSFSTVFTFTLDSTAPAKPVITSPASGSFTSNNKPQISGTAEDIGRASCSDGSTQLGSTTATAGGAFSFTPSSALADGDHSLTASATDGTGNTSPVSDAVSFTIDSAAPEKPVIASPASGSFTSNNKSPISGTAE